MTDPIAVVGRLDAAATRCYTPCGEGRMVWRQWGQGPELLLLHGGHGSWTHWIRVVEELSRGYRVIAPDLPGHGDSDMATQPYSAESLATILAQGLDALLDAQSRLDVVGFSFGGVMGGHLAEVRRERVRRLVLVGSGGLGLPRGEMEQLSDWRTRDDPRKRLDAHRRNLEILMIHDRAKVDDLAVYLQSENARRARLRTRPIALTGTLRRALASTDVPLAGIWGEHDATVGRHMAEYERFLRGLRPGVDFRLVESAGHWVAYEAPERFAQTLLDVLQRGRLDGSSRL